MKNTKGYFGRRKERLKPSPRKAVFETLEPRILLSADMAYAGSAAFDLTLRRDPGDASVLQLVDNQNAGAVVAQQALVDTNAVVVTGSAGDDKLHIDFSNPFTLPGGITFSDAGILDSDTLEISGNDRTWIVDGANAGHVEGTTFSGIENLTGGADNEDTFIFEAAGSLSGLLEGGDGGFDIVEVDASGSKSVISAPTGPDSGFIIRDGSVIQYAGFEPVLLELGTATNLSFNLANKAATPDPTTAGVNDQIELRQVAGNQFILDSLNGTFEDTTFTDPGAAGTLRIDLGDGTDSLTLRNLDQLGAALTIVGGAGTDTLVGPDADNTWLITITDPNEGTLTSGGVTANFSGFENLIGGSLTDTFSFADGANFGGTIDGGGGINTLDYTAYTSAVNVDLTLPAAIGTTGTATGTTGVNNIQNVTGGSVNDVLTGDGGSNTLKGGPGNDKLTGGAGNDILIGGADDDTYVFGDDFGIDTLTELDDAPPVIGGKDTLDFTAHTGTLFVSPDKKTITDKNDVDNLTDDETITQTDVIAEEIDVTLATIDVSTIQSSLDDLLAFVRQLKDAEDPAGTLQALRNQLPLLDRAEVAGAADVAALIGAFEKFVTDAKDKITGATSLSNVVNALNTLSQDWLTQILPAPLSTLSLSVATSYRGEQANADNDPLTDDRLELLLDFALDATTASKEFDIDLGETAENIGVGIDAKITASGTLDADFSIGLSTAATPTAFLVPSEGEQRIRLAVDATASIGGPQGSAATGSTGDTLVDTGATFNNGTVRVGDIVRNTTDSTVSTVVSIDNAIQITTASGEIIWDPGDSYEILTPINLSFLQLGGAGTVKLGGSLDITLVDDDGRPDGRINPASFAPRLGPKLVQVGNPIGTLTAGAFLESTVEVTVRPGLEVDNTDFSTLPAGDVTFVLSIGRTGTGDAGSLGDTLVDTGATFNDGTVRVGDTIRNTTDNTVSTIVSIDSDTQITTAPGEISWDTGDNYEISNLFGNATTGAVQITPEIKAKTPDDPANPVDLLDFSNISPSEILGMLQQVSDFLSSISGSEFLATPIPFTDLTLGDVLDFGQGFKQTVFDPLFKSGDSLKPDNNGDGAIDTKDLNFSSIQQLGERLTGLSLGGGGGPPSNFKLTPQYISGADVSVRAKTAGNNTVQLVTVQNAAGGVFKLRLNNGTIDATTDDIAFNAPATGTAGDSVQERLNAVLGPNLSVTNVTVSPQGADGRVYEITFDRDPEALLLEIIKDGTTKTLDSAGNKELSLRLEYTPSFGFGEARVGTSQEGGSGINEEQTITLNAVASPLNDGLEDTFQLGLRLGPSAPLFFTSDIAWNATAADVESALERLGVTLTDLTALTQTLSLRNTGGGDFTLKQGLNETLPIGFDVDVVGLNRALLDANIIATATADGSSFLLTPNPTAGALTLGTVRALRSGNPVQIDTKIPGTSTTNEVQTLTVAASEGLFSLSLQDPNINGGTAQRTGLITYDPTDAASLETVRANIETELNKFTGVTVAVTLVDGVFQVEFTTPTKADVAQLTADLGSLVDVSVTQNRKVYTVLFDGTAFAGTNVPQMVADSSELLGELNLDFGTSLGDLASLTTEGAFRAFASLNTGITFGLNLSPSEALAIAPKVFTPGPRIDVRTITPGDGKVGEVQEVTIVNANGGQFQLKQGTKTTIPIDFNAAAAGTLDNSVQSRLNAAGIAVASVTGGNGGPYRITFNTSSGNVSQLEALATLLEGAPDNGRLVGPATFSIDLFNRDFDLAGGSTVQNIAERLLDSFPDITVTVGSTSGNESLSDLRDDVARQINDAVKAFGLGFFDSATGELSTGAIKVDAIALATATRTPLTQLLNDLEFTLVFEQLAASGAASVNGTTNTLTHTGAGFTSKVKVGDRVVKLDGGGTEIASATVTSVTDDKITHTVLSNDVVWAAGDTYEIRRPSEVTSRLRAVDVLDTAPGITVAKVANNGVQQVTISNIAGRTDSFVLGLGSLITRDISVNAPVDRPFAAVTGTNLSRQLIIENAEDGTFDLSLGTKSAVGLAFDITPAALETKLERTLGVDIVDGGVTRVESAGGDTITYTINFTTDPGTLGINGANLRGSSIEEALAGFDVQSVSDTTPGGSTDRRITIVFNNVPDELLRVGNGTLLDALGNLDLSPTSEAGRNNLVAADYVAPLQRAIDAALSRLKTVAEDNAFQGTAFGEFEATIGRDLSDNLTFKVDQLDVGGIAGHTLELRFSSPVQVDAGGGKITLSTLPVRYSTVALEPATQVERRIEITTDFNDSAYQELGLLSAPTRFDGKTDDRIRLQIQVTPQDGPEKKIDVDIAADNTGARTSIDQLVTALQDDVNANGGPDLVRVERVDPEGNRIQFVGIEGAVKTIAIFVDPAFGPDNGAITELGFNVGQGDTKRGKSKEFFIEDAIFFGSFDLFAEDVSAIASLGFLGIKASGSGTIGDASVSVTEQTPNDKQVQVVTLTGATGGTFRLSLGDKRTAGIAFNAPATGGNSVQERLSAAGIDATVTGGNGGPYTISFATPPSELLEADNAGLDAIGDDKIVAGSINLGLRNPEDGGGRLTPGEIIGALRDGRIFFDGGDLAATGSTGLLDGGISAELGFDLTIAPDGFLSGLADDLNASVEIGIGSPNWLAARPSLKDALELGAAPIALTTASPSFKPGATALESGQLDDDWSFIVSKDGIFQPDGTTRKEAVAILSVEDTTPEVTVTRKTENGIAFQLVRVENASGGTFTLSSGGVTTRAIQHNALADGPNSVQSALLTLFGFAPADTDKIEVLRTTPAANASGFDPHHIEYKITFQNNGVAVLGSDASELTRNRADLQTDFQAAIDAALVDLGGTALKGQITVAIDDANGGITLNTTDDGFSIRRNTILVDFTGPDFDNLLSRFQNLSFADIIAGLRKAVEFLQTLDGAEAGITVRERVPDDPKVQIVTVSNATGGTFDLTVDGRTARGIAFDAPASGTAGNSVQEALLAQLGLTATVTGDNGGPYTITFDTAPNGILRADGSALADTPAQVEALTSDLPLINRSVSDLLDPAEDFLAFVDEIASDPAGSVQQLNVVLADALGFAAPLTTVNNTQTVKTVTLENVSAGTFTLSLPGIVEVTEDTGPETQLVNVLQATGGTFTLALGGNTTNGIAFDASAGALKSALIQAEIITAADTVIGGNGGPYTINFAPATAPSVLLEADASGLIGLGETTPIALTLGSDAARNTLRQAIEDALEALAAVDGTVIVSQPTENSSSDALSKDVAFTVTLADSTQRLAVGADRLVALDILSLDLTDPSGPILDIDFGFGVGAQLTRPFDLDLADIIGPLGLPDFLTNIVGVDASGTLSVDAGVDLNLAFGFDLTGDDKAMFIRTDDTGVTARAEAVGTGLEFGAKLGPFGLFVVDGEAGVKGQIDIGLLDIPVEGKPNGDGRLILVGISDGVQSDLTQGFDHLKQFFPTGPLNSETGIQVDLAGAAVLPLFIGTEDSKIALDFNDADGPGDDNFVVATFDAIKIFEGGIDNGIGIDFASVSDPIATGAGAADAVREAIESFGLNVTIDSITDEVVDGDRVFTVNFSGATDRLIATSAAGGLFVTVETVNPDTAGKAAVQKIIVKDDESGSFRLATPQGIPNFLSADTLKLPSLFALLSDPAVVVDGLDRLLLTLQDALNGQIMGAELPFVGNLLADNPAANFIGDFRDDLLKPLANTIRENNLNLDGLIGLIQGTIFDVLGPTGPFKSFGGLLRDSTNDGFITVDDIVVEFLDENGKSGANVNALNAQALQFDFDLGKIATFTAPEIDFDLGVPALGIEVDLQPEIEIDFNLHIGFGVDQNDGFYFVTGFEDENGNPRDELDLSVTVDFGSTQLDRASATGRLVVLALSVEDGVDTDGDGVLEFSNLFLNGGVDLADPGGDGRLSFSEMTSGSLSDIFQARLQGGAQLRLDAEVDFSALDASLANVLPSISTDILVDFLIEAAPGTGITVNPPEVAFLDVTLDLGSFISDFAGPVLEAVNDVLGPLDWLIGRDGFLNKRIPLLSDVAGKTITGKDLILQFDPVRGPKVVAFLDFVEQISFLAELVSDAAAQARGGSITLEFGDVVLADNENSGLDLSLGGPIADNPFQGFSLPNVSDLRAVKDLKGISAPSPQDIPSLPKATGSKTSEFTKGVTKPGAINFPILKPENVFKLLMGQTATLVEVQLPELGFDFFYRQAFPIFGPVVGTFAGKIAGGVQLGFGYDTLGLEQFIVTKNPVNLINGFFLNDLDPITGFDRPEAFLDAEIAIGAALSLGFITAGVEGGISGEIDFNLSDLNADGKVRIDEMVGNIVANDFIPLAIFDISGQFDLFLRAFYEIDLGLFSISDDYEFARVKLFSFDIPFDRPSILAAQNGDTLTLNIGPNSEGRLQGDTRDISESIFVKTKGDGSVVVWSPQFNVNETVAGINPFVGVKKIVADGGAGNDFIDLSRVGSGFTVEVRGGEGNDTLKGGASADTFFGDGGNDRLEGGDGADELHGGAGNDVLLGGDNPAVPIVRIDRDSNNELARIVSVTGSGRYTLTVDGKETNPIAHNATEAQFQRLLTEAEIDATVTGGDGGPYTITFATAPLGLLQFELLDTDVLFGEDGNDDLDGGPGTDRLDGGLGDDIFRSSAGNDVIDLASFGSTDRFVGSGTIELDFSDKTENLVFFLKDDAILAGFGEQFIDTATILANAIDTTGATDYFAKQALFGNPSGVSRITGGDFNDIFHIQGTASAITLDGAKGNDTYRVFVAGSGSLTATVDDRGNPWNSGDRIDVIGTTGADEITVTSSRIELDTSGSRFVNYVAPPLDSNVLQIRVLGDNNNPKLGGIENMGGDDTIRVESTAAAVAVRVNAGLGDDRVIVGNGTVDGIAGILRPGLNVPFGLGPVVLIGGTGHDTVIIDDSLDTSANIGNATAFLEKRQDSDQLVEVGVISGLDMTLKQKAEGDDDTILEKDGRVEFEGFEVVDVRLGTGNDTFTIGGGFDLIKNFDQGTPDPEDDVPNPNGGKVDPKLLVNTEFPKGRLAEDLGDPDALGIKEIVHTITGMTVVSGGDEIVTLPSADPNGDTINIIATNNLNFDAFNRDDLNSLLGLVSTSPVVDGAPGPDAATIGDGTNEKQLLTIDAVALKAGAAFGDNVGYFTLQLRFQETKPIPFGASATEIQDALSDLSLIRDGNVVVTDVSTGDDTVYQIEFTGALAELNQEQIVARVVPLMILGGAGVDDLNVESIDQTTFFLGGDDDDFVYLNVDVSGLTRDGRTLPERRLPPTDSGINATLTLDGEGGSDRYSVNLFGGVTASLINVFDTAGSGFNVDTSLDETSDELTVFGIDDPNDGDLFLLRAGAGEDALAFIALLNEDPGLASENQPVERVNYNTNLEAITVKSLAGDDEFYVDDTRATITIEGGEGNDFFQIGQLYKTLRTPELAGIDPEDGGFADTETTRGFLSNGISNPMTIFGDAGEDFFIVFRNLAVLTLNGGDDDDEFLVQAFALVGSVDDERQRTDLTGDGGADLIQYAVNAPVQVNGGDGLDTVIIIGTEFSDDFVVTEQGVFGAGLNVNFVNIEFLEIDGAEGDDRFFVLGTGETFVTRVVGSLGSDTFNINGPTPENGVISNDLRGHSGIIEHIVTSADSAFNGLAVEGISANVADNDEPAIVITQSDGFSNAFLGGIDDYTVVLTRPPREGTVRVNVNPPNGLVLLRENPNNPGVFAEVRDAANNASSFNLIFTSANWFVPQTVQFKLDDNFVNNPEFVFSDLADIEHAVASDDKITGTAAAGSVNGDFIAEEPGQKFKEEAKLVRTAGSDPFIKPGDEGYPEGLRGAFVTITSSSNDEAVGQTRLILGHDPADAASTLILDRAWTVEPVDAQYEIQLFSAVQAPTIRVEVISPKTPSLVVEEIDAPTSTGVLETGGDTSVAEGTDNSGADIIRLRLSQQPSDTVTVNLKSTLYGGTEAGLNGQLRFFDESGIPIDSLSFSPANFGDFRKIRVEAFDDGLVEGFHKVDLLLEASGGGFNGVSRTLVVDVADDDAPGVRIIESDGSTDVIEFDASLISEISAFTDTQTQIGNVFSPNVLTFEFDVTNASLNSGFLAVSAFADLDHPSEFLKLEAEGTFLGDLFNFSIPGDALSVSAATAIEITAEQLATLATDNKIVFTVTPSLGVNNYSAFRDPSVLTLNLSFPANINPTAAEAEAAAVVAGFPNLDSYQVALTRAPSGPILSGNPLLSFADAGDADTITRAVGNWLVEGFAAGQKIRVSGSGESNANDGIYTIANVSETVITLKAGDELVAEDAAGVNVSAAVVTVTVDPRDTRTSRTGGIVTFAEQVKVSLDGINYSSTVDLIFTDADWDIAQTVFVRADDDAKVDGGDTKVFAPTLSQVNSIQGPLFLIGGEGEDRTGLLEREPIMLPGETNRRPSLGDVLDATEAVDGGAAATITVDAAAAGQDLLDVLGVAPAGEITAELWIDKTIEITDGPGKNKVRIITEAVEVADGQWKLSLNRPWFSPFSDDRSDPTAIVPTAASEFTIFETNPNFLVDEVEQVDFLVVNDTDNVNSFDDPALLDLGLPAGATNAFAVGRMFFDDQNKFGAEGQEEFLNRFRIVGFGMGGDRVIGANSAKSTLQPGGITYEELEVVEVNLGPGNNKLQVDDTVSRADGFQTWTIVNTGAGNDVVTVDLSVESLTLTGAVATATQNTIEIGAIVEGSAPADDGLVGQFVSVKDANDNAQTRRIASNSGTTIRIEGTWTIVPDDSFKFEIVDPADGKFALNTQGGDDIVDGSSSTGPLVIFGGDGVDKIDGGSGQDIIFGDRGVVDYLNEAGVVVTRLGTAPEVITGTVVSAASTANGATLTAAGGFPVANAETGDPGLTGLVVSITTGKGVDQSRVIVSNDATTLILDKPWDEGVTPDITSKFRISTVPENQTDGIAREPVLLRTIDPDVGGVDTIVTGDGRNIVFGGADGDTITGGADEDIVLGDNGRALYSAIGELRFIETINTEHGGIDTITGNDGADFILGGSDGDFILAGVTDTGRDVVLGDNGRVTFGGTETFDPGEESAILSFNFNASTSSTRVIGTAGAGDARAGHWNNLSDRGPQTFGDQAGEIVLFDDGQIAPGITIEWGKDFNSGKPKSLSRDIHGQIAPGDDQVPSFFKAFLQNTRASHAFGAHTGGLAGFFRYMRETFSPFVPNSDQDMRLFEGYLHAGNAGHTVDVNIGGLAGHFRSYDLYVYLDADDSHSTTGTSVHTISSGSARFYLNDPDGNTFIGSYVQVNSTDPTAPGTGNYVVFKGLTGDVASIRIDGFGAGSARHPAISAVQVVGQSNPIDRIESTDPEHGGNDTIETGGGADLVIGGTGDDTIKTFGPATRGGVDADLVAGDNARATIMLGERRKLETTFSGLVGEGLSFNDTILTGNGEDIVLGGDGNDEIDTGVANEAFDIGNATVLSINFNSGVAKSVVTGVAGVVQAGNWNNLDIGKPGTKNNGQGRADITSTLVLADGTPTSDITMTWGLDLDSSFAKKAARDSHDQIVNPDTQNARLFEGYLHTSTVNSLGVDIKGLNAKFGNTGPYDVYVYLDADDSHSSSATSVRRISNGSTAYYLNDADGNTFAGEFVEVTSTDPNAPHIGNYVVFRDLLDDVVSIRIDDMGGSSTNRPAITGIQIVGGPDKNNAVNLAASVFGGDFDSDRVVGDNGIARRFGGDLYELVTTHPEQAGNDIIHTGEDGDIVLGGSGADAIDGQAGHDLLLGDNARLILFENQVVKLDFHRNDNNSNDSQFNPFGVLGIQLLNDHIGGDDTLTGGTDDDLMFGQFGNDHFIFSGSGLGHDQVVEAGDKNSRPNDLHDLLDFSAFGAPINVDLDKSNRQTINGDTFQGDVNLKLTLFSETAIEHVIGSAFDDRINGNDRNNALFGLAGDDELNGDKGDDYLDGGAGNDRVNGGRGNDTLQGGPGDDWLKGGNGADTIDGGPGKNQLLQDRQDRQEFAPWVQQFLLDLAQDSRVQNPNSNISVVIKGDE